MTYFVGLPSLWGKHTVTKQKKKGSSRRLTEGKSRKLKDLLRDSLNIIRFSHGIVMQHRNSGSF